MLGSRRETYTLIPLRDGWLRLPDIQVAWWNVDTARAMVAGLAGQSTHDSVAQRLGAMASDSEQQPYSVFFWVPLLIFTGLIAGYWLGHWARTRPLLHAAGHRAKVWLSGAGRGVLQHAAVAGSKLAPAPWLGRLRMAVAYIMPRTVSLWLCLRCIEREDRPETWCSEFRSRICSKLDMARHAPMSAIVEKIIEAQPAAEPARLRALGQSMDSALYGDVQLDFAAWKQDFRQQLRPRLYRPRRSRRRARNVLPALNPRRA